MVVASRRAAGPIGLGALDLERERCSGEQLGDRTLPDDVAPVHDGHGVTGPLDLVEEMRGQHDRAPLGHQGEDHVAHLLHAGRVEPVHRLVQDQQLGVPDQTGGDAEALAHAHRVLRHPVVGAMEDAHPLERRLDPVPRRRFAGGGEDLEVLPPGQMAVEPGFVDDGTHPRQSQVAMLRDGVPEQRHRPGVGVGQSQQHPDERGLAGAVRARGSRTRNPGGRGAPRRSPPRCSRTAWSVRGSRPPIRLLSSLRD